MVVRRYRIARDAIKGEHIPDGELAYSELATDTIQIEIPVSFWEGYLSFAIDSTGTKIATHTYLLSDELLKHAKHAYFEWSVTDFTATDAVVAVVLRNYTDATDIVAMSTGSDTLRTRSVDLIDDIKPLVGKELQVQVRVATASATAGATAAFRSAKLILVLGVS